MKALITSGGHGTRLRPITHTQNKHLIPIANKPMIHYALEAVAAVGISEVGIVTNAGDTSIQDALGSGEPWGVNITYIPQDSPLGVAHVVKISQDFIGDDRFLFYLGDNIVVGGVDRYTNAFAADDLNCYLTLSMVRDPKRFGVPEIRDGRIVRLEEKPAVPKSNFAVAGIYLYDSTIFEAVNNIKPSERGELEISDAHQYLLDKGYRIGYTEITGWWKDTGKPADLLEANRLVLENMEPRIDGYVDDNTHLAGKVVIEQGAQIVNSNIRGPVIIGRNTIVEDSYIGPFTSIDHHGYISRSEVEFSIVLDHCRIKDVDIRIESSLLGTNVQIERAHPKPKTHRFVIGDQSIIELM